MDNRFPARAELSLPDDSRGVALAREFARKALVAWSYPGWHDDVVLIVSELVSNALRHGRGAPVLRLANTGARLRVEVADQSPVLPTLRPAGATGGWGLRLVGRLAADWGVVPEDGGKTVWCELVPRLASTTAEDEPVVV
ncbi:ATP-binding protein [Goodfellowiella coeruleoviolacea]|uniref:ATP-binding protein n=1 Tax=Goodfellowiella coeruleoviolacea TaxID=334858 RepID=UPI0020A31EDF|nr:ATP-binding protein [Goodfellowiella coeruleoviolacea]